MRARQRVEPASPEASLFAARRALRTIAAGADRLLEFPELGRPMADDTGRRELYLPFGAGYYVLRYRLHRDAAVIIRVWHSREARGW